MRVSRMCKVCAIPRVWQIAAMRQRIEQLQMDLLDSRDENEQMHQRLSTTFNRISSLKTINQVCRLPRSRVVFNQALLLSLQRLTHECDKLKVEHSSPVGLLAGQESRRLDSASSDGHESIENLHTRLKNTSFDAARQRKLNKTLQTDNETLTKNLQSLSEKSVVRLFTFVSILSVQINTHGT